MEPCKLIFIDEIAQKILPLLKDSKTRYGMALSCRAFLEPMLDALWCHSQRGLKPLIRCLPDDAIQVPAGKPNSILITRPPLPHEWARFQYYARRIETFEVPFTEGCKPCFLADRSCYEILRDHHPGPILPNLECLQFYEWEVAEYAPIFIQPSLHTLIFWPSERRLMLPTLDSLEANHAPRLEYLELTESENLDDVGVEFSRAVCSLKHIVSLDFAPLPLFNDALNHLSSLRHFQSLYLFLSDSNHRAHASSSWGGFKHLHELKIMSDLDVNAVSSFLDSISAPRLCDLKLECTPLQAAHAEHLLTSIARFQYLERLTLDFGAYIIANLDDPILEPIDSRVFSPLFSIRTIKSFNLESVPVTFSAADLERMASSWSNLESLTLDTWRSGIELSDLAVFGSACPRLSHLAVKARPIPTGWTWEHDPAHTLPASPLLKLQLELTNVPDPEALAHVATFLAHLFPLADIEPFGELRWEDHPKTNAVKNVAKLKASLVPPGLLDEMMPLRRGLSLSDAYA